MAHIGVLRALEESEIPIDCIAGTSAGAIAGGAYAAGVSVDELKAMALTVRWRDLGQFAFSRLGIQTSELMENLIRERLPVKRFEDLRIPFAAVATDLITGKPVVMRDTGDIAFAIRASCNLPVLYVPVVDEEGRQLVDGGLVQNIPTKIVRSLGADVVIAVDVNAEGAKFIGPPQSAFGVMLQSFLVVQRNAAAVQLQEADAIIRPKVGHLRWDEVNRASEFIKAGEEAAREMIEEIRNLIEAKTKIEAQP
jgi:NTE family protein